MIMVRKSSSKSVESQPEQKIKELFNKLGFDKLKFSLKKEEEAIRIDLRAGEEAGLLIGYHGEILGALQLILGLMFYKILGEWQKIVVNVDDYLERRQQQLQELAREAAERVEASGKSEVLPFLSANERRIIHEFLASNPRVATESVGEGKERRLIISPK